jgi:hypothetical protein
VAHGALDQELRSTGNFESRRGGIRFVKNVARQKAVFLNRYIFRFD